MARDVLRFRSDEQLTHDNWEALYDTAAAKMAQPDWAAAGARAEQARGRVPDQRLRRSADGLRHEALHPLPADRRPGVSPGASRACGSGWRRRPAYRRARRGDRCARRSASCSSTSSRNGARACAISLPPDFAPRRGSRGQAATRPSTTYSLGTDASSRSHAETLRQLRVLDAGRILRRVQAAVRPDDRRQSRRLSRRRVSGAGPVRQPRLADPIPGTVQRLPAGDVSDLGAGQRHEPGAGQLQLDLSQRASPTATGGTRTRRPTSSTTRPPGWKPCRRPSRSATTATCTSSSSPCRSSPCTSGFWPRFWPSGSSSTAAGARRQAVDLGRRVLRGNVEQIFNMG